MSLAVASLGLCSEAGEVASLVKKWQGQGAVFRREDVLVEAGDALYYVALLADLLDCSLEDLMKANISKLARRYPDGYVSDLARHGYTASTDVADF